MTYNIHTCVGVDRRYDPARVAAVLREIDADIACLQEVDAHRGTGRHADQWAYLGEATGCRVVLGIGVRDQSGRFGNAILTRFPVLTARSIDLTVGGWEPRGAIDADLLFGDRVLRVIATHFGLRAAERRLQANRLVSALAGSLPQHRREADAVLLMGDLNEWRGRTGAIRLFAILNATQFVVLDPEVSLDNFCGCREAKHSCIAEGETTAMFTLFIIFRQSERVISQEPDACCCGQSILQE